MTVRVRARRTTLWAAAPLLLALVACGADPEPAAVRRPDASPSATPSASSSAGTGTSVLAGGSLAVPAGERVPAARFVRAVSRSLDRTTTARMSVEVVSPDVTLSGRGVVDYTGATPAVRMFATIPALGEGTIEARLVDEVLFVTMPMLGTSGMFYRVDLGDPGTGATDGLGDTAQMGALDPRAAMRTFGSGVRDVVRVGPETVGGVPTEHYWVRADGAALRRLLAAGAAAPVPETFAFDVWLDRDDRVRRVAADLGPQGGVAIGLGGWGRPVSITAPPPSQVQEMPRG